MPDHDILGVKIGPVVVARATEKTPKTQAQRNGNLICWALTVLLIAFASPITGVVLVILTAIYLAARTAPTDPDERKQP
jgi:MFS superfamily sulfate permease-like transporter